MKVSFVSPKYWAIKLLPFLAVRSALQLVFLLYNWGRGGGGAVSGSENAQRTEVAVCVTVKAEERAFSSVH